MTGTYDTNDVQYGEHDGHHMYDAHDYWKLEDFSLLPLSPCFSKEWTFRTGQTPSGSIYEGTQFMNHNEDDRMEMITILELN